jgi:hypothetical protein
MPQPLSAQIVFSLSTLKSLNPSQIEALREIRLDKVSDLLNYQPIHDARLLIAISSGQIAHDYDRSNILDAQFISTPAPDLPGLQISAINGIGAPTTAMFAAQCAPVMGQFRFY